MSQEATAGVEAVVKRRLLALPADDLRVLLERARGDMRRYIKAMR